jgi:hypothetical protein
MTTITAPEGPMSNGFVIPAGLPSQQGSSMRTKLIWESHDSQTQPALRLLIFCALDSAPNMENNNGQAKQRGNR